MSERSQAPAPRRAVVIYGCKSSPDEKESVADQHAQVRAAVEREGARDIIAEHGEDNRSGYRGERGPALEAAIRDATQAAAEHDEAELWVFHSSRLARGSGRKGQRSVNLIVAQLLYADVVVRSATDDAFVSPMLAGIAGAQAHKYSTDLSAHVRRGKAAQLARGDHLGGPVADGYRAIREHDEAGRVIGRTFRPDPDRAPLVGTVFAQAAQGIPDAAIARALNAQGARTRNGRPWNRRAVQNIVTNPFYAGRLAYKRGTPEQQVVDGRHPSLVAPAAYDRLQAMRSERDLDQSPHKTGGRPAENHALAGLAVCGQCGERLYATTSSYRRKDGSRARQYRCHAYHEATGTCDARPIDAEVVDRAVIAGLDGLLVDFDAWRRRIVSGHLAERDRLGREVEAAQRDHGRQAHKARAVEAKWSEYVDAGNDEAATVVLPIVQREAQAAHEAERRLTATQDALAAVPTEAPHDAMLDFANALQAAVSGRVDKHGTMGEVNRALKGLFDRFDVHDVKGVGEVEREDGTTAFTFAHPTRRALLVAPWVRIGVVHALSEDWPKLVAPDEAAPPLRWLDTADTERNAHDSHE